MFWQRAAFALLAGTIVIATAIPARAQEEMKDEKAAPAPAAAPAAAPAPVSDGCCYKTVCCTEWVPVKTMVERTTYKTEYKHEKCTVWKTECVPVCKERTVTCYEKIPVKKKEIRCVVKCVPVCVEKTVMQKHTVCKPVMHTVKKCVDKGCYETICVEVKPSCFAKLFQKKDDCCNPCPPCPKYKTKKVWKPCIVVEEKQVCKMEKFTECRPVTVKCTEMKKVEEKIEVEVCSYQCVAKTRVEKYTCYEQRKVACEVTKCVKVCVPCKEMVECCKMEKRTVMKQIPVCCPKPCCEPTPCCKPARKSCCN